jgi:hypothetical protein
MLGTLCRFFLCCRSFCFHPIGVKRHHIDGFVPVLWNAFEKSLGALVLGNIGSLHMHASLFWCQADQRRGAQHYPTVTETPPCLSGWNHARFPHLGIGFCIGRKFRIYCFLPQNYGVSIGVFRDDGVANQTCRERLSSSYAWRRSG